mmetsp:Transcript_17111/g.29875  ORF Transcript_17111/g.29875 Transcript_17111/m.29875 type:complete len:356 (-) Transcript_17111:44-1111(-)|eukprot:CAMPEP_0184698668 /NCGR_PEP_ID=MMETSP0313-20130426/5203_1 /TAXON_ID=2792 /ORGANISM="Porphyridium aerugineum, Strain SAG 1380-2" /LENGTH=355 /DNA_ID=CAMNT_0027157637 /DNA_START=650 /DNA_END=1717 /DNA_ORIENTATION=+
MQAHMETSDMDRMDAEPDSDLIKHRSTKNMNDRVKRSASPSKFAHSTNIITSTTTTTTTTTVTNNLSIRVDSADNIFNSNMVLIDSARSISRGESYDLFDPNSPTAGNTNNEKVVTPSTPTALHSGAIRTSKSSHVPRLVQRTTSDTVPVLATNTTHHQQQQQQPQQSQQSQHSVSSRLYANSYAGQDSAYVRRRRINSMTFTSSSRSDRLDSNVTLASGRMNPAASAAAAAAGTSGLSNIENTSTTSRKQNQSNKSLLSNGSSAEEMEVDENGEFFSRKLSPVVSWKVIADTMSPSNNNAFNDYQDMNGIGELQVTHVEFIRGKSKREKERDAASSSNQRLFKQIGSMFGLSSK